MPKTIALLPLARPTFDVPFTEQQLTAMLENIEQTGVNTIGSRNLLFDTEQTSAAIDELQAHAFDHLLILQVTFTDAAMVIKAASEIDRPLSIWAVPEPRLGARLRLNAFCGLNLAAHALGLNGREFGYLYVSPSKRSCVDSLHELFDGRRQSKNLPASTHHQQPAEQRDNSHGKQIALSLRGKRVARIGEHPQGFATCTYNAATVNQLTGITVDELSLNDLFQTATNADTQATATVADLASRSLGGLDKLEQTQLDKSLKLKVALDTLRERGNYDAFAIRCWPETFTEYGAAVCGPVSMLGEARVPCACEADVYGALTQLLLQAVADAAVFLVDLVDIDDADNTAVVWHCGQAPVSMADPEAELTATIHTNRKMPLLYEFPLKPGRVSFARLSQARGEAKLIIAGGEMLKRSMAFTGTSGVVRFDCDASQLVPRIIDSGMEHHLGLVYGDWLETLKATAQALQLPVIEL